MHDHARVQARYRQFADRECQGYSDHYFQLSHEIANDSWLVEFIAEQPETQPNLLLAAMQFLTGPTAMPRTAAEAKRLILDRRDEIEVLMRTRRTQTNEPGRCAAILPALPCGPLALVEVGASAGLCLLFDEYCYK